MDTQLLHWAGTASIYHPPSTMHNKYCTVLYLLESGTAVSPKIGEIGEIGE